MDDDSRREEKYVDSTRKGVWTPTIMTRNDSFSWRDLTGRLNDSAVADPVDQHSMSWCGFCYVVAVIQCIEDRGNILRRPSRRTQIDVQSIVDQFSNVYNRNACHGGKPTDLLDCLAQKRCILHRASSTRWMGHPRRLPYHSSPLPSNVPYAVTGYERPSTVQEVKRHIRREGPVVLMIHAANLKTVDARGVATDLTPRPINHSVSVIGWTHDDCWIVRNSWGRTKVPKSVPVDMSCVSFQSNDCEVEWEPWVGDPRNPGFLYLPMRLASLHPPNPSPWIVPTIVARAT